MILAATRTMVAGVTDRLWLIKELLVCPQLSWKGNHGPIRPKKNHIRRIREDGQGREICL